MGFFKCLTVIVALLHLFENGYCIQTYYMTQNCNKTISLDFTEQIRIKSAYGDYAPNTQCQILLSAEALNRMMIYFKDLSIEASRNCANDYLKIYDGELSEYSSKPNVIGKPKYCGFSTPSTVYESSADYMTLLFHSDGSVQSTGFDVVVTQFHEGYCYSWETKCSNSKCIDDSLTCNGYNPCGDDSDCDARTTAIIIGSTIGGVAFVTIVIGVVVCVYCMRRRNVGRAGYVASGTPGSANTNPAFNAGNYGGAYSSPPAYNTINYGVAQQQYPTATATATKQYA